MFKKNISRIWVAVFVTVFLFGFNSLAGEMININTASLEELDSLPGIGPSKAQAVIDYRVENGDFKIIEDILNVSGIGQTTFNNIKDLITVDDNDNTEDQQTLEQEQTNTEIQYSSEIVINEVLPNPEGSDDYEWIEIYNKGEEEVDLSNWMLSDLTQNKYVIPVGTKIKARGFVVFDKLSTQISLNNSNGETIFLYWPNKEIVDQIHYSDSARENYAWSRDSESNFVWTSTPTKAEENIITTNNEQLAGQEENIKNKEIYI